MILADAPIRSKVNLGMVQMPGGVMYPRYRRMNRGNGLGALSDYFNTAINSLSTLSSNYLNFQAQKAALNTQIAQANAQTAQAQAQAAAAARPAASAPAGFSLAGMSLPVVLIGGFIVYKIATKKRGR